MPSGGSGCCRLVPNRNELHRFGAVRDQSWACGEHRSAPQRTGRADAPGLSRPARSVAPPAQSPQARRSVAPPAQSPRARSVAPADASDTPPQTPRPSGTHAAVARAPPPHGIDQRGLVVDRLAAGGVEVRDVGDGVGVDPLRVTVHVVDRVALRVVARVVGDACVPAPLGGLLLGLDALRPGEQPAGRDIVGDERRVVGAPVERARLGLEATLGVVPLEQGLDLVGPVRPDEAEVGAVAVVAEQSVVGRADHVEVEVHLEVGELLRSQLADVEGRTDQAALFATPPREADLVGRLDLAASARPSRAAHSTRSRCR